MPITSAAASSERSEKHLQHVFRSYREAVKLRETRFASPRALGPKHYIAGDAYLCWKELILHPGRHRYESAFAARRTERLTHDGRWILFEDDSDIRRMLHCNDELVLVRDVEAVNGIKGAVPSLVGLRLPHQLCREVAGAGTDHLLSDFTFQLGKVPNDREVGPGHISAVRGGAGRNQVIESGSKVVDGIADNQGEARGKGLPITYNETISLRHWIDLGPDEVVIAVKELGRSRVEISDVGFRPMKF